MAWSAMLPRERERQARAYLAARCPDYLTQKGLELDRYLSCLGMRVSHQHSRVSVTADGSDLRHVQALLEEPTYGLVTQIVEPQAGYPGSSLQALPRKPGGVG
jgi:hypothetical protein